MKTLISGHLAWMAAMAIALKMAFIRKEYNFVSGGKFYFNLHSQAALC